jgi:hypothetical protein
MCSYGDEKKNQEEMEAGTVHRIATKFNLVIATRAPCPVLLGNHI